MESSEVPLEKTQAKEQQTTESFYFLFNTLANNWLIAFKKPHATLLQIWLNQSQILALQSLPRALNEKALTQNVIHSHEKLLQ